VNYGETVVSKISPPPVRMKQPHFGNEIAAFAMAVWETSPGDTPGRPAPGPA
jgi:hypothetical protein